MMYSRVTTVLQVCVLRQDAGGRMRKHSRMFKDVYELILHNFTLASEHVY